MRSENRELWLSRVSTYRESGIPAIAWCQENNIPLTTLRYWLRKTNNDQLFPKIHKNLCNYYPAAWKIEALFQQRSGSE